MCVRLYASRENSLYYYLTFLLAVFAPIPLCPPFVMLLFSFYTSRIRSVRFGKALILLVVHRLCTTLCLNNSMWYTCACVPCVCVCVYSIPVDLPGVGFSALCLTFIVFLAVCLVRCFSFFLLFFLLFCCLFPLFFSFFFALRKINRQKFCTLPLS